MAFFNGKQNTRPGVYRRIVNRGTDDMRTTTTPDEDDGLMVSYDGVSIVTLTLPGVSSVSYADGIATIAVLPATVSYEDGIVTIGG